MAGTQRKRKGKKNRWTDVKASSRKREISPDHVHSGISNRGAEPLVQQVVLRLEELCRAVIDANALKGEGANMIMSVTSKIKVEQDFEECTLSSVETSVMSKENPDSLVKLEICETESCKAQQNNFNDVNHPKNIDLCGVIKEECELDVKDSNMCINNVINQTIRLKTETVDNLTDTSRKVEQTDRKSVGPVECNGDPTPCVVGGSVILVGEQEGLSNQLCGNKTISNNLNKIILRDFSGSEYQHCWEHGSIFTCPMNTANQFDNSVIAASNKNVLENTSFSGVSYSVDEYRGNCLVEVQNLSDPQTKMGMIKCASHSLTSLSAEGSLDNMLPNEIDEGQSQPDLKKYHLKNEILCNRRDCEMVNGIDTLSDAGSARSSPSLRYAQSASIELSHADSCRNGTSAHSWSPASISVSSGGRIDSYLEPDTDLPIQYGLEASNTLPGFCADRLCQDVHMLQSAVPVSYPAICISPAAVMPEEVTGPGTEILKPHEEELFRRIEESLTERETLKYQKEELLKKIERSLTETESLKCREEELLKKIERSLTKAKSMKFREEELLRRIEVSLAQRETVKCQDEELLIRMKTSLKDTKYNLIDVESTDNVEFESKYKPDVDNSLPLKKRKKWLKTVTDDEERELHVRSLPLESFPSFPSWPMISIAELEAVGKLQHNSSFPSFPSQPMISIAELEAHTALSKLQQRTFRSRTTVPWISGYPHCCKENSFCDQSLCARDTDVGRLYGDFIEQNVKTAEDTAVFPICKAEDSSEDYSCSETSSTYASPQIRNGNRSYELLKRVQASSAETLLSKCSDVAKDFRDNGNLCVGLAADSLSSEVEVRMRTKDPSADLHMADTNYCRDDRGTEVIMTGSEYNEIEINSKNNDKLLEKITPSSNVISMDSKTCTEFHKEMNTLVESKCIKVEADSKDRIEYCGVIYPHSTDVKYKADIKSEASLVLPRFTEVDVNSDNGVELLGSSVNFVDDPK
jgi:hypothetical protein